jgi:ubiquinol-cytochrome c reductase cytochrome b subunit
LYAFLRTQYDKFVTGVLWPGLFILSILIIPFVDRYKKFSWKDRPIITAFGITGISQIMVTTYWGFYIPSDTTIPLVERLVIDPINLYLVMILMVPLSFGFSYMMIHLARDAERKAKLAKEKGPQKIAKIELSEKWINWVIIALIAFMVFLNIAAYNAAITGMNNLSLFFVGLILMVFAGLFHVYRYGMNEASKPPIPKAPIPKEKPKALAEQPQTAQVKELPDATIQK